MRARFTLSAALLAVATVSSANAADVVFGNLSAATDGSSVALQIDDGSPRALAFRHFARTTLEAGTHRVRVDVAGVASAEREIVVTDETVVVFAGTAGNYRIEAFGPADVEEALGAQPGAALVRHHVADGPANGTVVSEYECVSAGASLAAGNAQAAQEPSITGLAGGASTCAVRYRHASFGTLEASALELLAGETLQVFLAGNGTTAPYEIFAVAGARVSSTGGGPIDFSPGAPDGPDEPSPAVASLLASPTFWNDRERPLEGVSLFEIPGAGTVYGTWFGFEADGRASWLVLDGGTVYGGARRDLKVFEVTRANGRIAVTQVGVGTLQYTDCNRAELRLFLRGTEMRTLRVERSRAVPICVALDRSV